MHQFGIGLFERIMHTIVFGVSVSLQPYVFCSENANRGIVLLTATQVVRESSPSRVSTQVQRRLRSWSGHMYVLAADRLRGSRKQWMDLHEV